MSRRLVFVSALAIALVLPSPVAAQDSTLVEQGAALYMDQRCKLCHSIDTEGNSKGPLDGVGDRLTAEELEMWLLEPKRMTEKTGATRKPDMPAYPRLSEVEIDGLVAYMLSLKS